MESSNRIKLSLSKKLKEYANKMGRDHLGGDDIPGNKKKGGLRDNDGYDNVQFNRDMPQDESVNEVLSSRVRKIVNALVGDFKYVLKNNGKVLVIKDKMPNMIFKRMKKDFQSLGYDATKDLKGNFMVHLESVNEATSKYPNFDLDKNIRYQSTSISKGMWRYTGKEQGGKGVYRNLNNGQFLGFSSDDFKYFKKHLKRHFDLDESVNESTSKEAMGIAGFTGTRGNAVQKFIDDYNLDARKLFNFVKKGKLKDRMEFVSAIAGKPGNKFQGKMVGMFGESVNEGNKISDDKLMRLIPKMPKGYVGKNTGTGKYTISTPDGKDIVLTQSKDKKNWSYKPSNVALKILNEACWDTHKQVGMKTKGGKQVPNCVPKGESVVKEAMRPSQIRSAISKVKKQLMRKWKQKGGYENFGQKELDKMKSKFDYNPYGSSDERQISKMLDGFDNWAMNYDGNMREELSEITLFNDFLLEGGLPQNWMAGRVSDYHTKLRGKRKDYDDTNFAKMNTGQPDIEDEELDPDNEVVNEKFNKVEHLSLLNKALKAMPGSQNQKEIIRQLNVVRKAGGMRPLKETAIEEYGQRLDLSYILDDESVLDGTPEPKDAINKESAKKKSEKNYKDWKSTNEKVDNYYLKNAKFRLKKVYKYLDIEYKTTRRGLKYVQINYIPVTKPQSQNPEFVNVGYEDEKDLQIIGKSLKLKLKEGSSAAAQRAAIAISKKEKAGKPGYDKEGKSLKKEESKRDYKDEYKKFQSSTKSKKYRAELNKYNRDKGTYGNGDGKDASHKGGKIVGFESASKNRGRKEKSRLKKENVAPNHNDKSAPYGSGYKKVNEIGQFPIHNYIQGIIPTGYLDTNTPEKKKQSVKLVGNLKKTLNTFWKQNNIPFRIK